MRRVETLAGHVVPTQQQQQQQQQQPIAGVAAHATAGKLLVDPSKDAVSLDAASLFGVRGKVALVTGGSKGIGRMIASGLVANGAKVYVCSRKAALCESVADELNAEAASYGQGGSAVSLPGDLSSIEGVVDVVKRLEALETALHMLINNAGTTWGANYEDYPDEAWEKVMNLNVRHVFNLTQKCTPLLKAGSRAGDPARVVMIASIDGVRASQTFGPTAAFAYTTSKGALVHLTKALARALGPEGITVNAICPGVFPSEMTKFMLQSDASASVVAATNPLGRVGRTGDMAGTALYLCGPAGAWTSGAVLALDGGQHLASDLALTPSQT